MNHRLIATLLVSAMIGCLPAQSLDRFVIGSTGAFGESATHQIEYTAGELFTTTLSGPSIVLNQGFHQSNPPYNTSLEEATGEGMVVLFPNPAKSEIYLELQAAGTRTLTLNLRDMRGREIVLPRKEVSLASGENLQIDVSGLSQGVYQLHVADREGRVQVIRFQRN